MKITRKIDYLLAYGLLSSAIMIGALCYILFPGYIYDRILMGKSVTIICKLKEYQQTHQELPPTLTQVMNESGWWDELGYEKINDQDFRLHISNGFDSTAIYSSTENIWYGFEQEFKEINCQDL
jgi:hypothetical protein